MKLSFIIPAYNEENYLGKCLDAIFTELNKHPDISAEVIVVNNASTDRTKTIAMSYPKVKVVDETRKGLVFARQAGASAAQGELLAHIDADCLLPQGWMNTVLGEFAKSDRLVALSGPFICYDLSRSLQTVIKIYYRIGFALYWLNHYVLHVGSLLQGGNFVVKHWAWDKMEKAGADFKFYGEDIILAKNLAKLGTVKFTLKLPILTSGRRLSKEGVVRSGLRYVLNYFSVTYFKKPVNIRHEDVRS